MSQGPIPTGMAGAAANPSTDAETLREIAYHYPDLRPVVAANPSAYPGLLQWLGELRDPAIDAALATRAGGGAPTTPPSYAPATPRTERPQVPGSPATANPAASTMDTPLTGTPVTGAPVAGGRVAGPQGSDQQVPWGGAGATGDRSAGAGHDPQAPRAWDPQAAPAWGPSVQPRSETVNSALDRGAGTTGRGGMSTGPKVALAVLVVLALVLVGAVVFILNGGLGAGKDQGSAGATPSTSSTGSQSPDQSTSTSPTPTPSTSPSAAAYPAPDGAIQAATVIAPSGNIACSLSGDTVSCTIFEDNYKDAGFESCDGTPTTLTADATTSGLACGSTVAKGGTVLDYGAAATADNVACMSTQSGMSCWNTQSGRSFALARAGWQTGASGQISEGAFTF